MTSDIIVQAMRTLRERGLSDGGFSEHPGGGYRTDATAWAVLALRKSPDAGRVEAARARLAASQLEDGRVCVSAVHPQALWPTAPAVLAWQGSLPHREHHDRAVRFLLQTTGRHWEKEPGGPTAHDPSLRGWPWIENAFSFIEPTALALLALRPAVHSGHPRLSEGVRMIMDRQLPGGGWNYGNTIVYGQELYPQPESSGLALAALAGAVEEKNVRKSLDYLKSAAKQCRTPLSLAWAVLGLSAWEERPGTARQWIGESLRRQQRYGTYGTTLLSLLVLAWRAENNSMTFPAAASRT